MQQSALHSLTRDEGWYTLDGGIKFRRTAGDGSGPAPTVRDTVQVNYTGSFADGEVFDSIEGRDPIDFPLGNLVRGWQIAIPYMGVGDTAEIAIPASSPMACRAAAPSPAARRCSSPSNWSVFPTRACDMSDLSRVKLPNGIELDVWDTGPRDAPALVFLHGFPENHRTWRHQIAHLSDRFRCIAPDQRGYGNSSQPRGGRALRNDGAGAGYRRLAQALDLAEFTILGHDWGGALAWLVAAFGQASGHVDPRGDRQCAASGNLPAPAADRPRSARASQYMRTFRDPAHDEVFRRARACAVCCRTR